MTNDDNLDIEQAQQKILNQGETAIARAAANLGFTASELTEIIQNATVRASDDCVGLSDLANIEALPENRKRHANECSFCSSAIQAMNEPAVPERRDEFIAEVHEAQTTALADQTWLIIEENVETRNYLRKVLEGAGAKVETAASANEATEKAARMQPDGVIDDLFRPSNVLPQLENVMKRPFCKINFFVDEREKLASRRAGYHVSLYKPISGWKLVEAASSLQKELQLSQEDQRI
jgi:CheY-like chemotaxis protein